MTNVAKPHNFVAMKINDSTVLALAFFSLRRLIYIFEFYFP